GSISFPTSFGLVLKIPVCLSPFPLLMLIALKTLIHLDDPIL
ncbi:unnamed protein product, partial [marine sediment metagenome]